MFWECIYTLSAFILITHLYFRYSRAGRLMAKIPGPKEYFFIGNCLSLYGTPGKHIIIQESQFLVQRLAIAIQRGNAASIMGTFAPGATRDILYKNTRLWHKTYGRIYKLQGFMFRTVHLSNPDDVEILLSSSRYNNKDMPYTFFCNWLGNGILISNGETWQRQRKLLTPAFHFTILQKLFTNICEHTQVLLDSLETEVGKTKTDLSPFIYKLTVGIMCETLLGTKIADTTSVDKYIENVHRLGFFYINRLVQPWYTVDFLYKTTSYYLKEKSLIRDLHNFTEEIIRKRQADLNKTVNNEKHNTIMLDILLDKVNKGNIDEKRLRDEVNTILFESFDTTATTLIFTIVRLANESAIQKLIHEELETIFGNTDRDLTIDDLRKLKYLECCIKETLRLYPSVPFISRYNTEDLTIAGYRIPKNTCYNIHIYDLHHNPDLYSDPEKFVPERFLPENSVKRHPYAYIPFSAGSRNCIGQKFAIMVMKTALAGILRKYRLEPVTRTEDLNFTTDIILRVSHPMYVRFCQKTPVL